MDDSWFDDDRLLLSDRCPLPLDRPFIPAQAVDWGVSRQNLRSLHEHGHVRRLLTGVYAATQAPDDLLLRARALGLVLPHDAVVTDRTAAWLHGVDLVARSSFDAVPPVHAFHLTDTRMRRSGVSAGRRGWSRRT
jgi:hypothetical protein